MVKLRGHDGLLVSAAAFALAWGAAHAQTALPSPGEIAQKQAEQARPRTAASIDPAVLDAYVGHYRLWPNAVFTVTRQGSHLFAQLTGQGPVEFFPESPTTFFAQVVHAQISFVPEDKGAATGLVLHQGGFDMPAKRITQAEADAIAAAMAQRIASNTPSPGTEASTRRFFLSLEAGRPDYDEMTTPLAAALRQQWPGTEPKIRQLGALKAIAFQYVNPQGIDIYEVDFEHGKVQCGVAPLTDDGKVTTRFWRQLP